jgi:hypothetical protein
MVRMNEVLRMSPQEMADRPLRINQRTEHVRARVCRKVFRGLARRSCGYEARRSLGNPAAPWKYAVAPGITEVKKRSGLGGRGGCHYVPLMTKIGELQWSSTGLHIDITFRLLCLQMHVRRG